MLLDPPLVSALLSLSRTLRLPREGATMLEQVAFWAGCSQEDGSFRARASVPPHVARLFERNDQVFDADEVYAIGRELQR